MARRKRKTKEPHVDMARIIVDTRDASKDKFMPRKEAIIEYNAGRLHVDATNSKDNEIVYTRPTKG
jgi:hypothetical protein